MFAAPVPKIIFHRKYFLVLSFQPTGFASLVTSQPWSIPRRNFSLLKAMPSQWTSINFDVKLCAVGFYSSFQFGFWRYFNLNLFFIFRVRNTRNVDFFPSSPRAFSSPTLDPDVKPILHKFTFIRILSLVSQRFRISQNTSTWKVYLFANIAKLRHVLRKGWGLVSSQKEVSGSNL